MYHGLSNDFLYAASKIEVTFKDANDQTITYTGTAFFVKNCLGELCLITNRHLLDLHYDAPHSPEHTYQRYQVVVHNRVKDRRTGLPTGTNDILILNHEDFRYSSQYKNDIACLVGVEGADYHGQQKVVVNYDIGYELIANAHRLSTKLSICDKVAFPGYPAWHDKRNNLPILRTGTIASDPRFDYSFSGQDDGACIAYEAFSYQGSSGSPVFAIPKGIRRSASGSSGSYRELMLVGINAGHLPIAGQQGTHSGISYFYKTSAILAVIDQGIQLVHRDYQVVQQSASHSDNNKNDAQASARI